MKLILTAILAVALACSSPSAPVSSTLPGTWCPDDALTSYTYHDAATGETGRYLPGSVRQTYTLTFTDSIVVARGQYVGLFEVQLWAGAPVDTVEAYYFLPPDGVTGHYAARGRSIYFTWPVSAGATWFWELATHELTDDGWRTRLDTTIEGTAIHIVIEMTWEWCS